MFERYVFDEEERPASELLRQALNGRLDVLDDVVPCISWRSGS
jgi:hypothetical protein